MEVTSQTLDGTATVAQSILLLGAQLGEGLGATLRTEDGIIAEAVVSRPL